MNDHQKRTAPVERPGLSGKVTKGNSSFFGKNTPLTSKGKPAAPVWPAHFSAPCRCPPGRLRTLCMFHGTKNPVEPCHGFQPGRWEEVWAAPADRPRQSFVCRACAHGIVPHIRAALLGLVGCMAGRVPDGAAYPIHCRDFRARGSRHAA